MTAAEVPVTEIDLRRSFVQIGSRAINGLPAVAWLSAELEDPAWDRFLETTPLGQYQQSSLWARAKRTEGWQPLRVVLTLEGRISGGFQILVKRSRFGLVGYVSKGPVAVPEEEGLFDFLMDLVVSTVKARHLKALILQPPDASKMNGSVLARHRFLPNHLIGVNSANRICKQ